MAGKTGMGRLVFGGRQEYQVAVITRQGITGYVAVCSCELGDHYLVTDEQGVIHEQTTIHDGSKNIRLYSIYATRADAEAAIEQWQRQQADRQAQSGETPQEEA